MKEFVFCAILGLALLIFARDLLISSEISKCEQNGVHCEMRAIPVMELDE